MNAKANSLPDMQVACEICIKEIPVSEAKSDEASDYVLYFCGLECYEMWSKQSADNTESVCTGQVNQ